MFCVFIFWTTFKITFLFFYHAYIVESKQKGSRKKEVVSLLKHLPLTFNLLQLANFTKPQVAY